MKLHADPLTRLNTVTAYGAGFVEINKVRHDRSIVLCPESPVAPWSAASFETLRADDLAALLVFAPEVVLLGTGERQRFPPPQLLRPLAQARIGVEVMSTPAACRTYNILMAEGRRVLAALLHD